MSLGICQSVCSLSRYGLLCGKGLSLMWIRSMDRSLWLSTATSEIVRWALVLNVSYDDTVNSTALKNLNHLWGCGQVYNYVDSLQQPCNIAVWYKVDTRLPQGCHMLVTTLQQFQLQVCNNQLTWYTQAYHNLIKVMEDKLAANL